MSFRSALKTTGRCRWAGAAFGTVTGRECLWSTVRDIDAVRGRIDVDGIIRNAPSAQHPSVYRELVAQAVSDEVASRCFRTFVLPKEGLHATTAHDAMLFEVASKATRLAGNGYYSKGDVASRTLLGPRGIGKSTTMRSCAAVVPLLLPEVIPLYISYISERARAHSLVDVVGAALRAYGIPVQEASVDGIASALEEAEKYVLLLVDEIDKLYEAQLPRQLWVARMLGVEAPLPPATTTLHNLAHIGDHTSGRFATLLCGSSGMLMDLITMNAATNKDAVELFPLLKRGFNINDSKFRELRLYYGSSVSLANVGAVIGAGGDERAWTEATRSQVKLLTFVAGTTSRALDDLLQHNCTVSANAIEALYVGGADAARRTLHLEKTAELWDAIMKLLWHKNSTLMESLVDRDFTPRLDAIQTVDWPAEFQPLDAHDKKGICLNLNMDATDFHVRLVHLYDRDWLAFGDSSAHVYPRSLWSLVCFMRTLNERQRGGAPSRGASAIAAAVANIGKTPVHPVQSRRSRKAPSEKFGRAVVRKAIETESRCLNPSRLSMPRSSSTRGLMAAQRHNSI